MATETKTITLPVKTWTTILDKLESYWDAGPVNDGWQSDELRKASESLRNALEEASLAVGK